MRNRAFARRTLGLALTAAWIGLGISCNDDGAGKDTVTPPAKTDPLPGYVPDPNIYGVDRDPADFLEMPGPGTEPMRFPADIILLLLVDGAERAEAERLAGLVGGSVVGQNPALGMYELALATQTQVALDAAIATLSAETTVDAAGYDYAPRPRADTCPAACDNRAFTHSEQCPWDETDFFLAVSMWDDFKQDVALSQVQVGVVDTGLNQTNGEFNDVAIADAHSDGGVPTSMNDTDGHGTQVAGMIAADDGDGGVNGLASRILKTNMILVWGKLTNQSSTTLNSTQLVLDAGANIVNLSLGYGPFAAPNNVAWKAWRRLIERNPNVLFVAAAANEPFELTAWNDAPAGIPAANLISVSASELCAPRQVGSWASYGGLIDIVAPGRDVPLVHPTTGRPTVVSTGTSFATPIVTSAAAIIKSLRPSMTPSDIKEHLKDNANGGPVDAGGGMLSFAKSIEQILIDRGGTPKRVLDLVDADEDLDWDTPGVVVARICGGFRFNSTSIGSFHVTDITELDSGIVDADAWSLVLLHPEPENIQVGMNVYGALDLQSYTLMEDATSIPNAAELSVVLGAMLEDGTTSAHATSGALEITGCRIDERDPLYDEPMVLTVEGTMSGGMDYAVMPNLEVLSTSFDASFSYPFVVNGIAGSGAAVITTLETECDGGKLKE